MTVANIKTTLIPNKAKKTIRGVRIPKDGKVLVTLDKEKGALEDINGAIGAIRGGQGEASRYIFGKNGNDTD